MTASWRLCRELNTIAKNNPQLGTAAVTDVLGNLNALNDDIKLPCATIRRPRQPHHVLQIMGPAAASRKATLAATTAISAAWKNSRTILMPQVCASSAPAAFVTVAKDGKLAIETGRTRTIRSWTAGADRQRRLEHAYYLNYRIAAPIISRLGGTRTEQVAERYAAAKAARWAYDR